MEHFDTVFLHKVLLNRTLKHEFKHAPTLNPSKKFIDFLHTNPSSFKHKLFRVMVTKKEKKNPFFTLYTMHGLILRKKIDSTCK